MDHRKEVTEMNDEPQPDAFLTAIELMRQLAVASAHPGDDPDHVMVDQVRTVFRYLERYADSDPGMRSGAVYLLAWCLTQRAVTYLRMALANQLDRRPTEPEMMAELDKGERGALRFGRQDAAALTAVELTRQMIVASEHFANDPEREVDALKVLVNLYLGMRAAADPDPAATANALCMLFHMLAHGATFSLIAALENYHGHPPTEAEMMAELDDDERQVLSFREDKD
jgi:hypothetical protein